MKRGASGLSLLVAVNKPIGMTSHDVVNRCRRVFGERRVGHTGTLDPLASGVLPICVGPATRLDQYLTGHDKRYSTRIAFGTETTTDDEAGDVVASGQVLPHLMDETYAASFVRSLVGTHQQLPPAYSSIKVNGVKAYEAARKGNTLDLEFREIQILDAKLTDSGYEDDVFCWDAEFSVSKGTYIRSLARDIGRIVGCPAHVRSLHRLSSGYIHESQAVSLETLERLGADAAIDPVAALGVRFAYGDDVSRFVASGNKLYGHQVKLYELFIGSDGPFRCACMGNSCESADAAHDGELVAIIVENRLKALYRYESNTDTWKPDCVFSIGVFRG